MKLLLYILFTFVASWAIGQTTLRDELDSLKKEIRQSTYYDSAAVFMNGQKAIQLAKKLKDPTEEATIYQYYGNFYYFSSLPEKARKNYRKSIEIASRANNQKLVNSTKIRLAFMLMDEDLLAAEREFQILLKEALKNNYTENSIEIYNGLGNLYDTRQMKDEALKYYLRGLRIAEKSDKKYYHAMLLNNIGLVKFNNQQIKEAEKDFREALSIIKGMNEDRLSLNLNNNLGLVNKELKDYKESIKYYQNTLINAKKLGFPQGRGVAMLNLSDSYLRNKEFNEAEHYADSALLILKTFKQWDYVSMSYLIKAAVYRSNSKLAIAKIYVDSVLQLDKKYPNASNKMSAHEELSRIYELEGNYKLAFFHSNRFHTMSDSISDMANKDKFAQLQVLYGKEKVETELEYEKNKNDLLSKENELKQARIRSIVIVALFLLAMAIGFSYIRHVRLTRAQQKEFTQKLIENIDLERSRISKDLHDDIGQSLSVIKSKINLFNSGRTNDIEGLDAEVGIVIDQTRTISHFLHPSFIAKLGLERSLVSLTEKTQDHTGIVCSLSIKNDIEFFTLEEKTQIYRILQECINNTIKHANASALKISVKENTNAITITYRDNGKGIEDLNGSREGIGLLTIRERADKINAKIHVSNSSGKGYKLQLVIPKKD